MKKKILVVEDLRNVNSGSAFKVKKVVNSVIFQINEFLTEREVEIRCNDPEWTVNIVEKK